MCIRDRSYTFACSNLLDTEMRLLDSSEKINLCEYENQVMLVVNVASRCGYTYQYASLQKLYETYQEDGLVVIGVPSRDFMQEYSSEEDVAEFCSTEYGVNFPMLATSKVRGNKANPFYRKLIKETGYSPKWNFNKYMPGLVGGHCISIDPYYLAFKSLENGLLAQF